MNQRRSGLSSSIISLHFSFVYLFFFFFVFFCTAFLFCFVISAAAVGCCCRWNCPSFLCFCCVGRFDDFRSMLSAAAQCRFLRPSVSSCRWFLVCDSAESSSLPPFFPPTLPALAASSPENCLSGILDPLKGDWVEPLVDRGGGGGVGPNSWYFRVLEDSPTSWKIPRNCCFEFLRIGRELWVGPDPEESIAENPDGSSSDPIASKNSCKNPPGILYKNRKRRKPHLFVEGNCWNLKEFWRILGNSS